MTRVVSARLRRAAFATWRFRWLLAAVLVALGAAASEAPPPRTLSSVAPAGAPALPVRLDLAALHRARQQAERQQESSLTLTLQPGEGQPPRPITLVFNRIAVTPHGFTLAGRIRGVPGGRSLLVQHRGVLVGTLWLREGAFALRTVADGRYVAEPVLPRRLPLAPPRRPSKPLGGEAAPPGPAANGDATSQIDVLVLWSPAARTLLGGLRHVEAKVRLFVAAANDAYQLGGVAQRLELVGAAEIDYRNETAEHIDVLPDATDGFLDEIHALRDSYAADIVTLVAEIEVGGIAILLAELDPAFEQFAFNMVDARVQLPTVFAHELGHTMGLQHDRYTALRGLPPELPPDVKLALFPYSFGYVNQRAFDRGNPCFHTIMAYPDQCDDAGLPAIPLPSFSHPGQNFPPPDGDPVGVPADRPERGFEGPAHAVRTLNETRQMVAAFRDGTTGCRYALTPAAPADPQALPAGGDSLTVEIATDAGCAWSAHHQEDFLAVVGAGRGTGPGVVRYEVRPNPGIFRTGVLSIAAQTIAVRQLGAAAALSVCERTPAVRDAIVEALGGTGCGGIDVFALPEVVALAIVGMEPALRADDFQGLVNLTSLAVLGGVADLAPLAGLANLRRLDLSGNGLADIGALAGLGQLQDLNLNGNRVADLSPLEGLTRLQALSLNGNGLSSLSPLAGLTELIALQAADNAIADLSPLARLPIVFLLLANNAIADVRPLLALPWLRYVDLRGNPLNEQAIDAHIPALQARGVLVLFDEPEPRGRKAWWWSLLRMVRDAA